MQEFEEENSFHPEKDNFYSNNELEKDFLKDEKVNSVLQFNSENNFNSNSFNFIGSSDDKEEIYLLLNEMNKAINVNIDLTESQMVVQELLSLMKKPMCRKIKHNMYKNNLKFTRKIISLEGKILTNTLCSSNSNVNVDSTIKDTTASTRCIEQIPNETFNKKSN